MKNEYLVTGDWSQSRTISECSKLTPCAASSFDSRCKYENFKTGSAKTNEPENKEMYLRAYALNEDSNQPAHPRSLIRVFFVRMSANYLILRQSEWNAKSLFCDKNK